MYQEPRDKAQILRFKMGTTSIKKLSEVSNLCYEKYLLTYFIQNIFEFKKHNASLGKRLQIIDFDL